MNKHEHSHKEQKHPPRAINPGSREFQQQDHQQQNRDCGNSAGNLAEERNEQKDLAEQKARADQEGMTRHKQDNTPSPGPGSTSTADRKKNDQKK